MRRSFPCVMCSKIFLAYLIFLSLSNIAWVNHDERIVVGMRAQYNFVPTLAFILFAGSCHGTQQLLHINDLGIVQ